jgi:hypothetical protein
LEEINPKPYMELYQQLLDEIAGINSQMVHLKWELIYAAEEQKAPEKKLASMYNKANKLALQSITHYQLWRRTFSTPTPQNPKNDGLELPEDFDPEYHLVYLQATFQTARLFGKVFLTDPKQLCVFLQKSLECYELALSLATEWELSETTFKAESIICREMHELLPLKMTRIMNTGMCFHE